MKRFETRVLQIDGYEVIEFISENQSASIVVDIGNTLYRWTKNGHSIIYFPNSLESYSSTESLAGNPLMYPWANRLETDSIEYNGEKYLLEEKYLYKDANQYALHGLLLKTGRWLTKSMGADASSAWHTAEYHFNHTSEVFDQFPFEHRLEMTHRMDHEGITISLNILNDSEKDIPISFGFHPYFSLEKYDRDKVKVYLPYQHHVVTNNKLIPTGVLEPATDLLGNHHFELKKFLLDDGFVDRISGQYPSFSTEDYQVIIEMDDTFKCCVVYAPTSENKKYICIEPMVLPTNNLQRPIAQLSVPHVAPQSSMDYSFKIKVQDLPSSEHLSDDF